MSLWSIPERFLWYLTSVYIPQTLNSTLMRVYLLTCTYSFQVQIGLKRYFHICSVFPVILKLLYFCPATRADRSETRLLSISSRYCLSLTSFVEIVGYCHVKNLLHQTNARIDLYNGCMTIASLSPLSLNLGTNNGTLGKRLTVGHTSVIWLRYAVMEVPGTGP